MTRDVNSREVKVIDNLSDTILFECSIQDIELAYKKAEEYESMGLDVQIKAPSIPETLIKSLGASGKDIEELNKVLEDEIASHIEEEVGCSLCLPDQDKNNDKGNGNIQ